MAERPGLVGAARRAVRGVARTVRGTVAAATEAAAPAPKAVAPAKKAAAPAKKAAAPAKKAAAPAKKAAAPVTEPAAPAKRAAAPARSGPRSLLVLPGEHPWTAKELAAVRAALVEERDRLQREVDAIASSIADVLRDSVDGAGDDPADSGSKAYGREQELVFLASTQESVFQTRRALERLDSDTFGTCESCGGAIGKARLQAFPRATLCVACKQAQERR